MKTLTLLIGAITIAALVFAFCTVLTYYIWNGLAAYFNFKEITWFIALLITVVWTTVSGWFSNKKK